MSEIATLNSLVHGKQEAVSFRHLATLLKVPKRQAQEVLQRFSQSDPSLAVLWCVTAPHPKTGIVRTSLTLSPTEGASKQIWAVGPPSVVGAASPLAVWLAPDAVRAREFVSQPSHLVNELRDGRWDRIQSTTGEWNHRLDPRLGGDDRLASMPASKPSMGSSSLLASVKAKVKGKKAKAGGFMSNVFRSSSTGTNSLFSSKPLGADAKQKIQEAEKKDKKEEGQSDQKKDLEPTPVVIKEEEKPIREKTPDSGQKKRDRKKAPKKKARRVVEEESDNEGKPVFDDDDEEDEEEERMRELEREAAEKEKADEERAELEKEVMDLQGRGAEEEDDEEPESPELKELQQSDVPGACPMSPGNRADMSSPSREGGKRLFWQTFGHGPTSEKRIRKEVEETVEGPGGYLITRRVLKTFDENGNEVEDEDPKQMTAEKQEKDEGSQKEERSAVTPLQPKNSQSTKDRLKFSSLKKERRKDVKRVTSKLGSATKKTPKKKLKGDIMSYFGKKA